MQLSLAQRYARVVAEMKLAVAGSGHASDSREMQLSLARGATRAHQMQLPPA